MENAYIATIANTTVQVEALETNTVTIGGSTFVKLTASNYDVESLTGIKLVVDSENVIYEVVNGVPESTNYMLIDE